MKPYIITIIVCATFLLAVHIHETHSDERNASLCLTLHEVSGLLSGALER